MKPVAVLQTIANEGLSGSLYLIPSAGSTPLSLATFARALPKKRQVRCFSFAGMEDSRPPHDSVGAMASDYVEEMTADDPEGPYVLIGHCFGGTVAFEIVAQLEAAARPVECLILIDTFTPNFQGSPPGPSAEEVRTTLGEIFRQTAANYTMLPEAAVARFMKVFDAQIDAGGRFLGRPIKTDIHVIRTRSYPPAFFVNWPHLTTGTATEVIVPGNTVSVLVPPLVGILAREVETLLEA